MGAEWFRDEPGGLNRYFFDLVSALSADERPPPAVVVGPVSDPPPGLAVVERGWLPSRLLRYGRAARRLRAEADLVDTHFALYGIAALLAGAARSRPVVVHFHGPWAQESGAGGEPRLKVAAKGFVERRVYRRAVAAVTLTGSFKRLLVERYGVVPWRVAVVPPAVDLLRFTPGDKERARELVGLPAIGQVAVSVRRLVPRMGLDTLLHSWAALEAPAERTLAIVGDGPDRQSLEDLAATLGISSSVQFRGAVSDTELVSWYRAADFSVVPTLELEGFGLIVLESLACGTPVISSDVGGLPEATAGLEGRIITRAGDPAELAEALDGVLQGERATPSPAACRTHAERYSPEALTSRHREIYRRAASPSASRKLRVVYLDHVARISGAEICLHQILRALDGVDAHVVLGEGGPLEVRLREEGISTEVLPLGVTVRDARKERVGPGLESLRSAASAGAYSIRLARRLRKLNPDLVHTNSLKSGVYGALAARLARVPVVWHLHDRLATEYMSGHGARLIRFAIRHFADEVIVNSESTRQTLDRASQDGATLIPCPVELPDSPVETRDQVRRVGIVGRLTAWKGQHVFLDAVARAFRSRPVEAVVIGAPLFGEEDYADRIRQQAEELDGAVSFRGFVNDVPSELARLDLLVHASTIPEPFGQVVLEGMAAGLPVTAANAGGPAEIIDDGIDGLLYPPGDADALADRLQLLASDRELRARLGRAARESAAEFSPQTVAEKVLGVYRNILDGR